MKKAKIISLSILFLFLLAAAALFLFIKVETSPAASSKENALDIKVEVPYGETTYSIAKKLKKSGIIRNARLFYYSATRSSLFNIFYREKLPQKFVLKSGTYTLNSSMTIPQILSVLSSGQAEYVKVSIPEGLTISKIAAILEEKRVCKADDFIQICKSENFARSCRIPSSTVEGYLFPDTYYLNLGMDAKKVAQIMIDTFFEKIKEVPGLAEKSQGDLNDIVILASIVQREYQIDSEAALIASVFKNRIRQNIGLYSCATIEYIITEIQGKPHPGRILIEDTKIDSPYNTYKWAGLPPSPISNPGLVALDAATNTPKTSYYYFQVADESKGSHVFTQTFEEHKENH